MRHLAAVATLAAASLVVSAVADDGWSPAPAPLMTRWGAALDPARVHEGYPRPTLQRDAWMNLNGVWEFAPADEHSGSPIGTTLARRILVPFPVESALSGVGERHEAVWYRRTFEVPAAWREGRLLLHIDAADWRCRVWLNGERLAQHEGGFDRFTVDLTGRLRAEAEQELVVFVEDPTDAGPQPRGKQVRDPGGIWYTPSTGIWQTVWLEPVPRAALRDVRAAGQLGAGAVTVTIDRAWAGTAPAVLEVLDGDRVVAQARTDGAHASIPVADPRPWSPDAPHLYTLRARLVAADDERAVLDEVRVPFAFRSVEVRRGADGFPRIHLNGEPVFLVGPLDQGFWPDGLFAAPSDEALRFDVEAMKALGFNCVRKHVKVEPERWYHLCDTLGLLVVQDMPSGDRSIGPHDPDLERTAESAAIFGRELSRLVSERGCHPSVIAWVVFNEGWGQFDTWSMTERVRSLDPSRLVISASGWTDRGTGDVKDLHTYPGPGPLAVDLERATVLGEFGGLGLAIPDHTWEAQTWGYRGATDRADLEAQYEELLRRLWAYEPLGLSGGIYTQLTDVETECNGLFTYDRAVLKVDAARIASANRGRFPVPRTLVPASDEAPVTWRYTLEEPQEGWTAPDHDDASWSRGRGGFGREGTPGATVGTAWTTPRIALRRVFEIDRVPSRWALRVHHDEDARVYLNGVLVAELPGHATGYAIVNVPGTAQSALRAGRNVLAVECRQTRGGQYVDAGLVELVPPGPEPGPESGSDGR